MKVAISGGSGLIGRALVDSLAADGHEALVLSRSPERVTGLPAGAQAGAWDSRDAAMLERAVAGYDALVHLSGEGIANGRWTEERKRRIRASRVESTRAVAQALTGEGSPKVLLQASAVGYYGARGDERLDESSAPGDDFLADVCQAWEAAGAMAEDAGVRRAVLRTGVVLSRDGGALPRMLTPFRLFAGGPLGDGSQWFPWIHIDDHVGACRFLLETPAARGAYNLTAPAPLTNRDFSRVLGKVMGRPSFLPAPAFVFKILFGEMATLLLDGQRALPARLEREGYEFLYPDARAALEQLLA